MKILQFIVNYRNELVGIFVRDTSFCQACNGFRSGCKLVPDDTAYY